MAEGSILRHFDSNVIFQPRSRTIDAGGTLPGAMTRRALSRKSLVQTLLPLFYTLKEAKIVIENWRRHYNTVRLGSLGDWASGGYTARSNMLQLGNISCDLLP